MDLTRVYDGLRATVTPLTTSLTKDKEASHSHTIRGRFARFTACLTHNSPTFRAFRDTFRKRHASHHSHFTDVVRTFCAFHGMWHHTGFAHVSHNSPTVHWGRWIWRSQRWGQVDLAG